MDSIFSKKSNHATSITSEVDEVNPHMSKFELNHILQLVANMLKNGRLSDSNINQRMRNEAIEGAIKNKEETQTGKKEAAEYWKNFIASRLEFIKSITHYQSTDIATEYAKNSLHKKS